jgi:hypothetical protein
MKIKCVKCGEIAKYSAIKNHFIDAVCLKCKTPIYKNSKTIRIIDVAFVVGSLAGLKIILVQLQAKGIAKLQYMLSVAVGVVILIILRWVLLRLLVRRKL